MKNCQKVPLKKVDGSGFFWSDFCHFGSKSVLYGFIEKQAPQKALCLGPDPPPGKSMKFIDFYRILPFLGPSIEPEKPSVKSASTPYPPKNDHFIAFLLKIYRVNGFGIIFNIFWSLVLYVTLPFFGMD
jgi:hypothetical protein